MGNIFKKIIVKLKSNRKSIYIALAFILAVSLGLVTALTVTLHIKNSIPADTTLSSDISSITVSSSSENVSSGADNGIRLVITSPQTDKIDTTEQAFIITGTCDPAQPLLMNGSHVTVESDGSFHIELQLNIGSNTFNFEHKGESKALSVYYRYVVINGYNPSTNQTCPSGGTLIVSVSAKTGSSVTALLGNTLIELSPTHSNLQEAAPDGFTSYSGSFTMPSSNIEDILLGKIKFTGTYNGISESFYSGNITCRKSDIIVSYDPSATPTGGSYINVGSGYIAEIVTPSAETFNGNTTDDWSRPTNNYLPKGTVDYCATGTTYDPASDMTFVTLRCGRRVYLDKPDAPSTARVAVVNRYIGTLPDHNEITVVGFETQARQTVLTLGSLWKAPFCFDLHNQSYTNPAVQDYTLSAITFSYVDITFCYATVFNGEISIPSDHPVFSSVQIIRNTSDTTLRLFLKKTGKFYGWDSYYNPQGQLCFEFLNPVQVQDTSNAYGTSLSGVKIFVDAGHGGIDSGAIGRNPTAYESHLNLSFALKLKAQLEALGAEVILSRTSDTTLTAMQRMEMLRSVKPDLCISIHHDSNNASYLSGFSSNYFNAFSKSAAEYVYYRTANTGIYSSTKLNWHYFFLARTSCCPVVLTENGYMSNQTDLNNMLNDSATNTKVQAITQGIVDYFRSIKS